MTLPPDYFDDIYAQADDPWGFEGRWYEARKRNLLLAALPRAEFRSAFEPGCSNGMLTALLAPRCRELLSTDVSQAPLAAARRRLAGQTHVRFRQGSVPQDWPDGAFDLIVLSEVGYYCGDADLGRLVDKVSTALTDDGVLVACHWRHAVTDYPQSGDHVHARLREGTGLVRLGGYEDADFLLDVLVRPPAASVAAAEGLA